MYYFKTELMFHKTAIKTFLFSIILVLILHPVHPCSMYKITAFGKTMVGNNEDSWRLTSRIWFEQGSNEKFGVAYVGYTDKQSEDGAINEYGLVYDAFTVAYNPNIKAQNSKKQGFSYQKMKLIMQHCKTIIEVYHYLKPYDLSFLNGSPIFNGGMLLFVDKSGEYLTVEADTMIIGNANKYVLANFSASRTKDLSVIKMERYCKGVAFLKNKIDTSLAFCTALSDTMHVCRKKIGDGTLYTTIYDLERGIIYMYFFHDYKHLVTFNIKEELSKGDHTYSIPHLFPLNEEYAKFMHFKTPFNSRAIFILMIVCAFILVVSAIFFLIRFIRYNKTQAANSAYSRYLDLISILTGFILAYYIFQLLNNQAIFYFPAPYKDIHFSIKNITAYVPFALLLLLFPILRMNIKMNKNETTSRFTKVLLSVNSLIYLTLLIIFGYWGLIKLF